MNRWHLTDRMLIGVSSFNQGVYYIASIYQFVKVKQITEIGEDGMVRLCHKVDAQVAS